MVHHKPKILFVLSSCGKFETTGKPTGWYLPEFAHPWDVLHDEFDIHVASPAGGEAPLDPGSISVSKDDVVATRFHQEQSALWTNTTKLEDLIGHAKDYEAIFYVGGHGPMFDLTDSAVSHALILEFNAHSKILSAVCHGPTAFVTVKNPATQEFLIAGQRVTGFSDTEEEAVGLTSAVPFSLEQALKKAGAVYEKESDWKEKVVVAMDGRLVTGQNPASAGGVARAVRDAVFGELTTGDEVK